MELQLSLDENFRTTLNTPSSASTVSPPNKRRKRDQAMDQAENRSEGSSSGGDNDGEEDRPDDDIVLNTRSKLDMPPLIQSGPIIEPITKPIDYSTRVFASTGISPYASSSFPTTTATSLTTSLTNLLQDARTLSAREGPRTRFLLASDIMSQSLPRCAFESLAAQVFRFHTKNLPETSFDLERSGAEWWVQVRPEATSSGDASVQSLTVDGVRFHWDKDETLRDVAGGLFVHPHISTVTYLTSEGAPTVIFEDGLCDVYTGAAFYGKTMDSMLVVYPSLGKHLSFDGRLLHAAVGELAHPKGEAVPRITFLVNIWLNHAPLGVDRILEEEAAAFSKGEGLNMFPRGTVIEQPSMKCLVGNDGDKREYILGRDDTTGDCEVLATTLPIDALRNAKVDTRVEWGDNKGAVITREVRKA